jgi:hypothetical protein
MKLYNILNEEGQAAQAAHKLGFVSKGWGRWADPKTGQIVAKTVNDKLEKIAPEDNGPQQSEPSSGDSQPASDPAPQAKSPQKLTPEYSGAKELMSDTENSLDDFVGGLASDQKVAQRVFDMYQWEYEDGDDAEDAEQVARAILDGGQVLAYAIDPQKNPLMDPDDHGIKVPETEEEAKELALELQQLAQYAQKKYPLMGQVKLTDDEE